MLPPRHTAFSYDANGIRTQKRQYKADGEPEYYVNYVWQDGLLTHQSMTYYFHVTLNGTEKIVELPFTAKFVYDESNTPVGCLVNDEAAVGFVRNLQGDVIAVVTHEGDVLAEYSYDPWGKVTISHDGETLEGLNAAVMALYCPFAYRGYNYDFTTGLYYLQSRYYNPEWGRFLNVDDTNILLATQGEALGANLFAYCNNDPVNYIDTTGQLPQFIKRVYSYINLLNNVKYRFTGYVFGQDTSPANQMRYGLYNLSYNGCEVIAVYNALKYLGKFKHLYYIIQEFELNGGSIWLDGLFGTYPTAIGQYMKKQGFKVKTFYLTKTMDEYIQYGRCFIIVYAHTSGIHAVMARGTSDGKRIVVYNRYNNCTTTRIVSSISQLVKEDGFKLIVGYWIYN